jgi:hypothetical protein
MMMMSLFHYWYCIYVDDESKLLEEITGGMASQRLKTRDPFTGGLPKLPDLSPRMAQGFGTANTHRTSGRSGVHFCLILECLILLYGKQ